MGGQQPMAMSGNQGGQPFYNVSMMQGPQDDPYQMMQKAGNQIGAGQVSGGIGPPNELYPALGGGQSELGPWTPTDYNPDLLGGNTLMQKPGGVPQIPSVTDPVNPVIDMTPPVPEITLTEEEPENPLVYKPGGGPTNTIQPDPNPVIPKPGGGPGGNPITDMGLTETGGNTLVRKPGPGRNILQTKPGGGTNPLQTKPGGPNLGKMGMGLAQTNPTNTLLRK